jgi:hypothetical protein
MQFESRRGGAVKNKACISMSGALLQSHSTSRSHFHHRTKIPTLFERHIS